MPDRECGLCGCGAYNAHSMDFVLSFYGFLSIRTVVGHLDIPSIFPLRSTLLRILPEGSIPMTPYVAILAPWSYSSYIGITCLLSSLTHGTPLSVYKEDILCPYSSVVRSQTEE